MRFVESRLMMAVCVSLNLRAHHVPRGRVCWQVTLGSLPTHSTLNHRLPIISLSLSERKNGESKSHLSRTQSAWHTHIFQALFPVSHEMMTRGVIIQFKIGIQIDLKWLIWAVSERLCNRYGGRVQGERERIIMSTIIGHEIGIQKVTIGSP